MTALSAALWSADPLGWYLKEIREMLSVFDVRNIMLIDSSDNNLPCNDFLLLSELFAKFYERISITWLNICYSVNLETVDVLIYKAQFLTLEKILWKKVNTRKLRSVSEIKMTALLAIVDQRNKSNNIKFTVLTDARIKARSNDELFLMWLSIARCLLFVLPWPHLCIL